MGFCVFVFVFFFAFSYYSWGSQYKKAIIYIYIIYNDTEWNSWMASPTQWTWVSANSGRCWRMGKPGVLQSVELQRVRHNWGTEQQQQMFIFLDIMPLTPNTACAQCVQLCDLMDCSPPGSSVHGISQARIPEWVAIPSSRGSSPPRDQTRISCIAGRFFTAEPPGLPHT